jgi:hypothetical protein
MGILFFFGFLIFFCEKVLTGIFLYGKLAVGKESPDTTMKKEEVIQALEARQKAAFCTLKISRPAKLRAAHKALNLRRVSEIQFQVKTDYANRKPVKLAVQNRDRLPPQLPSHIERVEVIKQIKFWHHKNGNVSLPQPQGGNGPLWSRWELDGQPVTDEEVDSLLTAEDTIAGRAKKAEYMRQCESEGKAPFNTVILENIVEIR